MILSMTAPFDINWYIVKDWVYYHNKIGVDNFVICGVNTNKKLYEEILELKSNGFQILYYEINAKTDFRVGQLKTEMALKAKNELMSDWIISNDSDEFFYLRSHNLKSLIRKYCAKFNSLYFSRFNMLPINEGDLPSPPRSQKYLAIKPIEISNNCKDFFDCEILEYLLRPVGGKMIFKANDLVSVDTGSHFIELSNKATTSIDPKTGFVVHYPYYKLSTTLKEQKLRTASLGTNSEIDKPGWHRRYMLHLISENKLEIFYRNMYSSTTPKSITSYLEKGVVVEFEEIRKILNS